MPLVFGASLKTSELTITHNIVTSTDRSFMELSFDICMLAPAETHTRLGRDVYTRNRRCEQNLSQKTSIHILINIEKSTTAPECYGSDKQ